MKYLLAAVMSLTVLSACSPEIGSKEWCEQMGQKEKGNWTANEAADYAKNCLFK